MGNAPNIVFVDPDTMDLRFFGPPLKVVDDEEDYQDLRKALGRLDDKLAYILLQTISFDRSQADVARELGLARQAIHIYLKKGIERLRLAYSEIKAERKLLRLRCIPLRPPKQEEEQRVVRRVVRRRRQRLVCRRPSTLHEATTATEVYNASAKDLHFLTATRLTRSINMLNSFPPAKRTKAMKKALKGLLKEKETRTQ